MTNTSTIYALIEIPALSSGVKYEIDKKTGHIVVDRFLKTAMHYPCNYGHIPNTIAGDGDELDVLVITPLPLQTGVYIHCRPVGTLHMTDEKGEDTKIIAVPINSVSKYYQSVESTNDIEHLHPGLLDSLRHFFTHYKDLDKDKWVEVNPEFGSAQTAEALIRTALKDYEARVESH